MKNLKHFYLSFAIVIVSASSVSWYIDHYVYQATANSSLSDIPSPPPKSLDAFYPPASEQPVFLFAMLKLETHFTGIFANLMEEDFENAGANYQKFKDQYLSLSKMVPEWESSYPIQPVEDLGKALQSGEKEWITKSAEEISKVCHSCHISNMVPVQQKYHWKDFQSVTLSDPVSGDNIDFAQLMRSLSMNFTAIGVDLEEKQVDNAKKHYEMFKKRFVTLRAACTHCHAAERKYYVDENVRAIVDKLGEALNEINIDPQLIGNLSMQIGMESCSKCHHVHLPAALTKQGWKMHN